MITSRMRTLQVLTISAFGLLVGSCVTETKQDKLQAEENNSEENLSLNTNFDGKIFSVPSPVQTAMLIKDLVVPFKAELLHSTSSSADYKTEQDLALNFGVYAADLGYASMYNQKAISLNYLSVVEDMTKKLGLESTFDMEFMKRFENNISNEDSTMQIVSDAFKNADLYLKNAKRRSTTAYILTGGWVESMHLASKLNELEPNAKIVGRIGEQKQSLETIINVLNEYNEEQKNDQLIKLFSALKKTYEEIEFHYEYAPSKTDAAKKTTTFNHSVDVIVKDETMKKISFQIEEIRDAIISKK